MQPSHAIGDLHFAPARLGMARLDGAYAWKSLEDAGALVVGGSDAPVERGDPLIEFYAAVARKDLKGFSAEGWRPEEALSRPAALALFTTAPAYAALCRELHVPLLGLVQLQGHWNGPARRRDGLSWLGWIPEDNHSEQTACLDALARRLQLRRAG